MASSAAVGLIFASCESFSIDKVVIVLRSFVSNSDRPRRHEQGSLSLEDPAIAIELTRVPSRTFPNLESDFDANLKG